MKNKNRVAVKMNQYGIKTVVNTYFEELLTLKKSLEAVDEKKFYFGRGKKVFYQDFLKKTRAEDQFFSKNSAQVARGNKRWERFLGDCLMLAVLDFHLFQRPIELVHPDQYKELSAKAASNATSGIAPNLIEGVSVIFKK